MTQLRADMPWKSVMIWLAGLVFTTLSLLKPAPAMALPYYHTPRAMAMTMANQSTVAAIPNKAKATAKDAEEKAESSDGNIQTKGKAKQVQTSAMNASEDLKEGAKSAAKKGNQASR